MEKHFSFWEALFNDKLKATKILLTEVFLYVSFQRKKLWHISRNTKSIKSFDVLLGKTISNQKDSLGTPLGLHYIYSKIGEGAPLKTVFKARMPIGQSSNNNPKEIVRDISTRIMQLCGLEEGFNREIPKKLYKTVSEAASATTCDTLQRLIYLHGTSSLKPWTGIFTNGCIALSDKDVIELFNITPLGSLVWIESGTVS